MEPTPTRWLVLYQHPDNDIRQGLAQQKWCDDLPAVAAMLVPMHAVVWLVVEIGECPRTHRAEDFGDVDRAVDQERKRLREVAAERHRKDQEQRERAELRRLRARYPEE